MMRKDQTFVKVTDPGILGRLARSAEIHVLNRFDHFEAVNGKNGHRYRVNVTDQNIVCTCPDARSHPCKHEIATARVLGYFMGAFWGPRW